MSRVVVNLEAMRQNLLATDRLVRGYGASWTAATKALSGHPETLRALFALGVRSVTDSRLDNLRTIGALEPAAERWYLRPPAPSAAAEVVACADASLTTELDTVEALGAAARAQGRTHHVVPMVEIGDLREGIPPGKVVAFCERVLQIPGVALAGLGGQVGCVSGLAPAPEHVSHLLMFKELIELKLGVQLPLLSAGSTMFLPAMFDGLMPAGVGHFRIGEALYLGSNLVSGGVLPGFNDDVIRLEAEVVEIWEKPLVPMGQTVEGTPFKPLSQDRGADGVELQSAAAQRGWRVLVDVGQLDTEVSGLTPEDPRLSIAGASSDIAVLNVGRDHLGLRVGSTIRFSTSYSAFVRLMSARYLPKEVEPSLETFTRQLPGAEATVVPPVLPPPLHTDAAS